MNHRKHVCFNLDVSGELIFDLNYLLFSFYSFQFLFHFVQIVILCEERTAHNIGNQCEKTLMI